MLQQNQKSCLSTFKAYQCSTFAFALTHLSLHTTLPRILIGTGLLTKTFYFFDFQIDCIVDRIVTNEINRKCYALFRYSTDDEIRIPTFNFNTKKKDISVVVKKYGEADTNLSTSKSLKPFTNNINTAIDTETKKELTSKVLNAGQGDIRN